MKEKVNRYDCDSCTFKKLVIKDYKEYCKKEGLRAGYESFFDFLCKHNLLTEKTKQHFIISKAFELLYPENNYHKTKTVQYLSDIFDVHENTIWNTLKHQSFDEQERFYDNKFIEAVERMDLFN